MKWDEIPVGHIFEGERKENEHHKTPLVFLGYKADKDHLSYYEAIIDEEYNPKDTIIDPNSNNWFFNYDYIDHGPICEELKEVYKLV